MYLVERLALLAFAIGLGLLWFGFLLFRKPKKRNVADAEEAAREWVDKFLVQQQQK